MHLPNLGLAKNSLRHAQTTWGITTSVMAFIGDILKPSFNFAPILLMISGVSFIVLLIVFRKKAKVEGLENTYNSFLGSSLSFAGLSVVAWTILSIAFMVTPRTGVAAQVIPGIEEFQKQVMKIGQDVTEIKGSVGRIEEKLDALAKTGVVIPNPKSPEEFYHNARFYEVKGNTGMAQQSYEKFLEMAPNYIDAHLAYQTLMNNTQGIEVTRRTYAELERKHPDDAIVALMATRLLPDRGQKITRLKALTQKYPNSGPIYFELAQEFLSPGPGNITIDDMKNAKESFDKFKEMDEKGLVKPFYIDKKVLEAVYKKRDDYDKMVTAFYSSMMDRPVEMKVELLPNLVSISIIPKELKVKKIFYSIDDPNPTIDTGISPVLKDMDTGEPMPNFQVSGKVAKGKHVLYAKYVNAQGKESAVFNLPFEVNEIKAVVMDLPGELGSTKKNYEIVFQSLDGRNYQFFYSLNQPNPDQQTSDTSLTLKDLVGPQELFYYGVSEGEKTPVYSQKLQ